MRVLLKNDTWLNRPYNKYKPHTYVYITAQTAQCKKTAYIKKQPQSIACWSCGCYHMLSEEKNKK